LGAAITAAIFAGKLAFTTRDAADDAHVAYTATQRAFVTINDVDSAPIYDPKTGAITHWKLLMNIENSGNSPTVDLRVIPTNSMGPAGPHKGWNELYPGVKFPEGPNDPEVSWRITKDGGTYMHALIGPHAKFPISSFGIPLSTTGNMADVDGLLAGKWRAYTFGAIHYRDIFPGSPDHVTKYCYGLSAEKQKDSTAKLTFYLCSHWNCADDECKADRKAYEAEITKAFKDTGKQVPSDFYDSQ
jgi:hypothetical protein